MNEPPQRASEVNLKLQDLEERQRLLRERVILVGNSLIEERDKMFLEMQEMKKLLITLERDSARMKEFILRISEQISDFARKEELAILQRQFNIMRSIKK